MVTGEGTKARYCTVDGCDGAENGTYDVNGTHYASDKIYLTPDPWNIDGAWYAARFWNDTGSDYWLPMTDENGDGIYECDNPGYKYVIFCRMTSNDKTTLDWKNVWNQTGDITVGSNNVYTITGWDRSNYTAESKTHVCVYNAATCEDPMTCVLCDTTKGDALGHVDDDTNHECDRCESTMGTHAAAEGSHVCDYCGQIASECVDNDKNHNCDVCGKELSQHTPASAVEENVTAPTCTADGKHDEVVYCSYCNGELERKTVTDGALGHDLVDVEGKTATCTEDGYTAHKDCSRCDYTEGKEVINAFDHKYSASVTTAPTCTAKGVRTYTCEHDASHTYTEDIEINANAHDWNEGVVITQPTCTTVGIKTYTCKHDATHTKTEDVAINSEAHKWNEGVVTTQPTCSTVGVKTYNCEHDATHTKTEDVAINPEAHNWNEGVVTTEPTCEDAGIKTYTCIHNAEHTKTEPVAKLGHKDTDNNSRCDTCNTSLCGDNHDWIPATCTEAKTCSKCGTTEGAANGHSVTHNVKVDATCTEDGTIEHWHCSSCGKNFSDEDCKTEVTNLVIPATNHEGKVHHAKVEATCVNEGTIEYWSCSACDKNFSDEDCKTVVTDITINIDSNNHKNTTEHEETDATCTEAGYTAGVYCEDCKTWISGHVEIPATNHEGKVHHAKVEATCVSEGTIEYWSCSACEKNFSDEDCKTVVTDITINIDSNNHKNTTEHEKTDATCTEAGYTAGVYCEDCKTWISGHVEIPATNHDWEEATCETPKTCKTCGDTEGTALGHNYDGSDWMVTENGQKTHTCTVCNQNSDPEDFDKNGTYYAPGKIYLIPDSWNSDGAWFAARFWNDTGADKWVKMTDSNGDGTYECENLGYKYVIFCRMNKSSNAFNWSNVWNQSNDIVIGNNNVYKFTGQWWNPQSVFNGSVNTHDCIYSAATCEDPMTCVLCDTTKGDALGHVDDDTNHECDRCESTMGTHAAAEGSHVCDYCGQIASECVDNDKNHNCDVCGKELSQHTPASAVEENVTAPTCTADGKHDEVVYCSYCDDELERKTVTDEALGHDLAKHDAKAATCTEKGWEAYETCSRCDYTTYKEIAALGHKTEKAYEVIDGKLYLSAICGCESEKVAVDTTKAVPVANEADLNTVLRAGYSVTLTADINLTNSIKLTDDKLDVTIDLAGHTITADWESDDVVEVLYIVGATVTINGDGAMISGNQGKVNSVVSALNGATLTINGGYYYSADIGDVIFAKSDAENNLITNVYINGGKFEAAKALGDKYYVLDTRDNSEKENRGIFHVTGGEFVNFDPANHTNDGDYTNKLADGYHSIKNGNVYTVSAHTIVADAAVEPTCTATGLTAGSHCSVCNKVLVAQETVDALGHDEVPHGAKDPTCTEIGWNAYVTCTRCNYTTYSEIAALGHKTDKAYEVIDGKLYLSAICGCESEKTLVDTEEAVPVANEADLKTVLTNGYSVVLTADIDLTENLHLTKAMNVVIDLAGKTIDAAWDDENGVVDVLWADGAGVVVTITGNGKMTCTGNGYSTCVVSATDGAKVTIVNGTFASNGSACIYATRGGAIEILDGEFSAAQDYLGNRYLLDVNEAEKLGTITVYGGTFHDFDPANHTNDGASYTNKVADGYHSINNNGVYTVSAHDYTYSVVVTDPDCETAGYTTHTCICGDYYVDTPVAALGHTDGEVVVENNVAPTCTATGSYDNVVYCTVCGTEVSRETVTVNALGHKYDAVVTAPTCESAGYTTYTCHCGDTYTADEVEKLGHDYEAYSYVVDGTEIKYVYVCENDETHKDVRDVSKDTVIPVSDAALLEGALENGYSVVLGANIEITDEIYISGYKVTIDLGGYTIKNVAVDANEVVEVIWAYGEGTKVTINGNGAMISGKGSATNSVVSATDGAVVTINGGYYYSESYGAVIYATRDGVVNINGGKFEAATTYKGVWYVLDINEAEEVRGVIHVHGGEFVNYNPANCENDGDNTNKVVGSCHSIQNGTSYVVSEHKYDGEEDMFCNGCNANRCEHSYEAVVTQPTCTKDGYTTHTCSICQHSYVDSHVDATGHSYKSVVTAPTCVAAGYTTYTCSVCGDTYVADPTDALGHTEVVDAAVAPTCTATGLTEGKHCSVCNKVLVAQEVVDALGHTDGKVVVENNVAPTCTADGSYDNVVYCTVCGAQVSRETVVVPATGHTNGAVVVENKVDATCTADGSHDEVVYCTVCGDELSRNTVTDKATGHTNGAVVVENNVAPTCTATGSYDNVVYCTVCEAQVSRETIAVPATGHTNGDVVVENNVAPTCTATGSYDNVVYCTVCGTEVSRETVTVNALGHKYDAVVTEPTCTTDGYTTYKCSVCGDTYVDNKVAAKGHVKGDAVIEHNVDATCTEKGSYETVVYCSVCNTVIDRTTAIVPAKGHSYESEVTKNATCTETGVTTYTCSTCGDSYTEEIEALGHNEIIDEAVEATCTATGLTAGSHCSVCDAVIVAQEVVPSGHNYVDGNCKYCGVTSDEYFTFTLLSDDTYSIKAKDVNNIPSKVVIPSTYNGKAVTSIYYDAFRNCSSLTSIVIPDSITVIYSYAFYYCSNLQSIEIPDSIISIDQYAFYYCSSLQSIEIPDNVTSIKDYTFYHCASLTSVVIPDGVTSIGGDAFGSCIGLTSIVIPNSVTAIYSYAFSSCISLTSVMIPSNITTIYSGMFSNCTNLTSVVIPDSVTSIGKNAFAQCSSLTNVVIPGNVTSIGYGAFSSCSKLTSVVIPDSVTSIGDYAFSNCSGLTSVVISNSVTSIGYHAFDSCSNLQSIEIPDSVTTIRDYAFYRCTSLTSVIIGDSVTSIGWYVFADCNNLTSAVIGDSITTIEYAMFCGCSNLTSITIPNSVTSIGESAFFNCGFTSVVIPNSVSSIGKLAFAYCEGLASIVIPESVTIIDNSAFNGCTGLTDAYYTGTEEKWAAISIGTSNDYLINATRYYYSETHPTTEGNFWCYDDNGDIKVWCNDFVETEVVEPTCTTAGYTIYACTCGFTYTGDEVAALGHKDEDNNHICDNGCGTKLSNCADSTNDHNCDVCGEKLSNCADNTNDHNCDVCGEKISNCEGGEATCITLAVCTICGKEYGEYADHNYDDVEWVVEKEANYVEEGLQTRKCNNCEHVDQQTIPMKKGTAWYFAGTMNNWNDANPLVYDAEGNASITMELKSTDQFKIAAIKNDWNPQLGFDQLPEGDSRAYYFSTFNDNIVVKTPGTYKFTVSLDNELTVEQISIDEVTIYLTPNANWKVDNARFAVYVFAEIKGENDQNWKNEYWIDMNNACDNGVYSAVIPTGYTFILCRMNPGTITNGWESKWNQSVDLQLTTDGTNHYTVAEGAWDKGAGSWSTYTPVHKYTEAVTKNATCTTEGIKTFTCNCGHSYTETIGTDSNAHNWNDATCNAPKTCSLCNITDGNALEHVWGSWMIVEHATPEASGLRQRKCTNYGCTEVEEEEVIYVPTHTCEFTLEIVDDTYLVSKATCTAAAVYYKSCECGEAGTETFTSGSSLGHKWSEYKETTAPTFEKTGSESRTCSRCSSTETRDIAKQTKLYLIPNGNWKVDNARFAAYFFGNGEKWVSMKYNSELGVYEVDIPTDKVYPNVIFVRMNPNASANNWNNKWNQTADLNGFRTSSNNCYTVKENTWDKGGGTWSRLIVK